MVIQKHLSRFFFKILHDIHSAFVLLNDADVSHAFQFALVKTDV